MRATSVMAREKFESSGKKEKHYRIILKAMRRNGIYSSRRIAKKSNLDSVQVSRRMSELKGLGLVEEVEVKFCKEHRMKVIHYQKV